METCEYMTVVETKRFIADASGSLTEDERTEFIQFIAQDPTKGDLIQGTGGVRKVRWARGGRGKSGGVRIIYYYHNPTIPIFLLTLYRKNQKATITPAEKNLMKQIVRQIVDTYSAQ
jgi:hypothetical protein